MARCALIWLAFSKRPLRMKEVAEAAVRNPELNTAFDPGNKFCDPSDVLAILGSLVTYSSKKIHPSNSISLHYASDVSVLTGENSLSIEDDTISTENSSSKPITLAHFSVQEYLVSETIKDSRASKFGITKNFANSFIAESCPQYFLL